jgi:choline kinase
MDEFKVLITTSGIGSRLGNLTKHTNKSLIRVGKKPALSYAIESYPKDVEIVITLGYFGDHVKQFIRVAYPDRKITFVEVDKYDGEGSSLGYSMLKAKDLLQCPFIFHASDTIQNAPIPEFDGENWIGVCKKENYSEYRTVSKNGFINEKGSFDSDLVYIGLAGINDYELFWNALEDLYNQNPNNKSLSDCNAFNKMNSKWKVLNFKNWLDTGNVVELNRSRALISDKFDLLDKEDESIFLFDDFVVKFFANKDTCRNRVLRAESLGSLVPQLQISTENFYRYKYADGDLLSHCINDEKIKKLLNWSKENLWIPRNKNPEFQKICEDFYFTKTKNRIKDFQLKNRLIDEELIINGRKIPPLNYLIDSINKQWLCGERPVQFHGDFILENILTHNPEASIIEWFTLIDWRQDFGGSIYDGDIYYDFAKLNHNLIFSHDIVYKGLFHVAKRENVIECDILRSERLISCQEVFESWLVSNDYDLKKVRVLTALVWLNMSPLHDFKTGEFLYYFGAFNLFKSLCNLNYL